MLMSVTCEKVFQISDNLLNGKVYSVIRNRAISRHKCE